MNCLNRIAPKSFLGKFPLKSGAKYVGIFMCCVSVICVLSFLGEVAYYSQCDSCSHTVLKDIYSFSTNIIVYCTCMFFINLWFIWGVTHEKPPVVLAWVVVTTMWWLQGSTLILILLLFNTTDISITWITLFCFSIVGFVIFGYCILIGYAYWLQIKGYRLVVDNSTTLPARTAQS